MKNLYRITNKYGKILCFQVARSEEEAVDFARMYGAKGTYRAEYVREN